MLKETKMCPHCWKINCEEFKNGVKHEMPEEVKKALNILEVGGVLPDPEHNAGKNWRFGAAGKVWPIINAIGRWIASLPTPNKQATGYFDPFSCVSESLANALETLLNYLMTINPSIRPILEQLGMIDENGKAKVCGRFLAVISGTKPGEGNSQYNVFEALRKYGICGEKFWPVTENMTEAQYFNYDKNGVPQIPASVKKQALKFCNNLKPTDSNYVEPFFDFNYEDVPNDLKSIEEATKRGTLVTVVGGAILGNVSGALLYRNDGTPLYNHQVQYVEQEHNVSDFNQIIPTINIIFDTYDPFLKKYYEKYPFKFVKVIYLTLKKKLNMTQIYRQTGKNNCYLYVESLDAYFGISDSDPILGTNGQTAVVAGGDLVKPFSGGKYPNIPEMDIPDEKIIGDIKARKK